VTLRSILSTILGNKYGLDARDNPVWNRRDGSQIVLDSSTAGVPSVYTQTAAGLAAQYDILASATASALTNSGYLYPTVNDISASAANSAAIQLAIATYGRASIIAKPGDVVYHQDTLLLPARAALSLSSGVRLQQYSSTAGRITSIRLGNVERFGSRGINGFIVIAHTSVSAISYGAVKVVKSGGNYTFSYSGPGDSTYGTGVTLTTSGKATLIAAGGAVLLMRSALSAYPLSDGTYTQSIIVVPSQMPARACTLARASTTVTVTETAHGRKSGDLVMIFGTASADGMFRILTVPTTDTYTYTDPTGSGTGAAYAYANADVEMNFGAGASVWSDTGNAASGFDSMLMHLVLTNGLVINNGIFKNRGTAKYAGNLQGVTRVRINNPYFDNTCSDGFTCQGGAFDVRIVGSAGGSLVDNLHGIGASPEDTYAIQRPAENGTNGIDGYYVQVKAVNQVIDAVRIFGGKSNSGGVSAYMDNIEVDVSGNFTGNAGAFSIIEDTGTPNLLDSVGMELGKVKAAVNPTSAPNVFFVPVAISAATSPNNIDKLEVSGSYTFSNTATHGYSPAFIVHSSGVINTVTTSGVNVTDLKVGGGTQFAGVYSRKGGTIGTVNINGGRVVGCTRIVSIDASLVQSGEYFIRDVSTSGTDYGLSGSSWPLSASFSNISGQIFTHLFNCGIAAPATKCVIAGFGPLPVKTVNLGGAGANVSVTGGLSVDGTKLAPNAGDIYYNTNAAYSAGIGTYAYGTAATRIAA
jgi:hypothetical protein